MKKLVVLALVATLLAAGAWSVVYLNRWEWTRALWTTMVFVAAEVALVGVVLANKIDRLAASRPRPEPASPVRQRLVDTRPERDRFAWLAETTNRTNVFVTMMVGGGILVSGVLWIVDKVAARSVTPGREQRLADELASLSFPVDGLVPDESMLFAADLGNAERSDLALLLTGRPEEG